MQFFSDVLHFFPACGPSLSMETRREQQMHQDTKYFHPTIYVDRAPMISFECNLCKWFFFTHELCAFGSGLPNKFVFHFLKPSQYWFGTVSTRYSNSKRIGMTKLILPWRRELKASLTESAPMFVGRSCFAVTAADSLFTSARVWSFSLPSVVAKKTIRGMYSHLLQNPTFSNALPASLAFINLLLKCKNSGN